ncbi:general secretion pathway protein GspB [Psychrosphaera sp.]|nr:general secretion pathway protein GspB [Psychrosphaera sp.]
MSFLYKALIKEQNTQSTAGERDKPNNSNAYAYAETANSGATYVNSGAGSNSLSWLAWLIIAILLLIVGSLAGYIVGSKPVSSQVYAQGNERDQLHEPAVSPVIVKQASEQPSMDSNTELSTESNTDLNTAAATAVKTSVNNSKVQPELVVETQTGENLNVEAPEAQNAIENEVTDSEQLVINVADINSSNVKVEDVSSDLQARFAEALAQTKETASAKTDNQARSIQVEVDSSLVDINDLPNADRAFIPELQYEMHIYSSDVNERWVRINNTTLYEGDRLTPYLRLAEIRQGIVIWESRDRRFSQIALEDYR